MPIYEYRCGSCGHYLDALQKISDPPLSDCPACSEKALKRLISAPSFRLKGSGWYETDFKSDKDKRRNLADGSGGGAAEPAAAGKESGKSGDSKPGSGGKSESSGTSGSAGSKSDSGGSGAKSTSGSKGSGSEAA